MTNWNDLKLPEIVLGEIIAFEDISLIPLSIKSEFDATTLVSAQEEKLIEILESDSVNKLKIKFNKSGKYFLPFLQVVGGGKQDRMITRPFFMESETEEVLEFPVNCVEQGRWQYSRSSTGEQTSDKFEAKKNIRMNASMGALNMNANQGTTWSSISWYQEKQGISSDISPSQSFMEMEQSVVNHGPKTGKTKKKDQKIIPGELKEFIKNSTSLIEDQTGLALLIDEKLHVVEIYGNNKIWQEQSEAVANSFISEIQIYEKGELKGNSSIPNDLKSIKNFITAIDFTLDKNLNFGMYYTNVTNDLSSLLLSDGKNLIELYIAYSNTNIKSQMIDNHSNVIQQQMFMPNSEYQEYPESDEDS